MHQNIKFTSAKKPSDLHYLFNSLTRLKWMVFYILLYFKWNTQNRERKTNPRVKKFHFNEFSPDFYILLRTLNGEYWATWLCFWMHCIVINKLWFSCDINIEWKFCYPLKNYSKSCYWITRNWIFFHNHDNLSHFCLTLKKSQISRSI